MLTTKVLIIFSLLVATAVAGVSRVQNNFNNLPVGDYFYFYGPTAARDRDAAIQYCVGEGGELATLTSNTLLTILVRDLPEEAAYWIDGMAGNARDQFRLTEGCATEKHLEGVPDDKLDLGSAASCLTLVKGANLAASKIKAEPCSSTNPSRVICQIRLSGECATEDPNMIWA